MKQNIKKYILAISLVTNAFSFEVNTHQALTRCATTSECNQNGTINLKHFIEDTELGNVSYKDEKFEKYDDTYFNYSESGKGFEAYNISFKGTTYKDLIEAGVVLEDAVWYNHTNIWKFKDGDGRFNNHFYAAQFIHSTDALKKRNCNLYTLGSLNRFPISKLLSGLVLLGKLGCDAIFNTKQTHKALTYGYGQRTDNITWALGKNVKLGARRVNDYNLHNAFKYYRNSFIGNEEDRKKNQAKLFVSLGFMIHMIQDLHSPAHVRDGSHPLGDYLEIFFLVSSAPEYVQKLKNSLGSGTLVPPKSPKFRGLSGEAEASLPSYRTLFGAVKRG